MIGGGRLVTTYRQATASVVLLPMRGATKRQNGRTRYSHELPALHLPTINDPSSCLSSFANTPTSNPKPFQKRSHQAKPFTVCFVPCFCSPSSPTVPSAIPASPSRYLTSSHPPLHPKLRETATMKGEVSEAPPYTWLPHRYAPSRRLLFNA